MMGETDRPQKRLTRSGSALANAVEGLYEQGETDYYLPPLVLVDEHQHPIGRIEDGDAVIFCCRRGEREYQLTKTFVDPSFDEFPVKHFDQLTFVTLTLYHEEFKHLPVAFRPTPPENTLGEILSKQGLKQVRLAESEKFAHVTFFFNGGRNQPFPGQVDLKVPSFKDRPPTENPELNLPEVTRKLTEALSQGEYALAVVNFANGDIIGHLPDRKANIKCAEAIDKHLGITLEAAKEAGYVTIITADHGLLECLVKPNGKLSLSHTTNPVPFIIVPPTEERSSYQVRENGILGDVAPTILEIMGIPQPPEMTGRSMLVRPPETNTERVLLIILDGWGLGPEDETNPIFLADTPVMDRLWRSYPHAALQASGEAVGLKPGMKGNSEAGHMNIGAGRIVLQDEVRMDQAIKDGSFYTNEAFLKAINDAKSRGGALHLLGLLSKKSSHGTMDYPLAILEIAKREDLNDVYVHFITDGRSTDPGSAPALLREFEEKANEIGLGEIVTGVGRGYALDRDRNYQKRTKVAYDALVFGEGYHVAAFSSDD